MSPDETFEIGRRLGQKCKGGELFLLSSDLGGGKTTLTKGIAKGLGSEDVVSSPTFTVSNIYSCRENMRINHFDFYRLNDGGMVEYELQEIIGDPSTVIIIEWGDVIDDSLPARRVDIEVKRVSSGEDHRSITISLPHSMQYLGANE